MPDQMMHLAIAHKLIKKLDINDEGAFYLGSIAPDAVHVRTDSTRAEKSAYHFHADTKIDWTSNAQEFIHRYVPNSDNAFYMGYASHILVDIVWAYGPFKEFNIRHASDTSPLLPADKAYYYDLRRIDYDVFKGFHDIKSVFNMLMNANPFPVAGGSTIIETQSWKKKVIDRYEEKTSGFDSPPRYMNLDEIFAFFDDACEFAAKFFS